MLSKDEQIVATVPTSELAETIRLRLLRKVYARGGTPITVYVFHDRLIKDEYHVGVANERQGRLSEDEVLRLMIDVSDFQEEQLREEAAALADVPPMDDEVYGSSLNLDEYFSDTESDVVGFDPTRDLGPTDDWDIDRHRD